MGIKTPLFVRKQVGGMFTVVDETAGNGNIWWLHSGTGVDEDGAGQNPDVPFASLDFALARLAENQGDRLFAMQGHAETITGAAGITVDKAGISIIGLGLGGQRPRFLMDGGTDVTALVTAKDATLKNIRLAAGHDGIVAGIDVQETGCRLLGLEFEDNAADEHFLTPIKVVSTTDNKADGLEVAGCRYVTPDSGALEFLEINGDIADLVFNDNRYFADAATAAKMLLMAGTKVVTGLEFERNRLISGMSAGDIMIDNGATTNTGIAAFNLAGHHDVAGAVIFDCDGIRLFENYSTAADGAQGVLLPAADDDSS